MTVHIVRVNMIDSRRYPTDTQAIINDIEYMRRSNMSEEIEGLEGSEEMADIELGYGGEVLPPKNDKIALIDADTVAFTACLSAEEETSEFNPETQEHEAVFVIDLMSALEVAECKIQRILDRTGCLKAELHFTGGRDNFRYVIFSDYKANRTSPKSQRTRPHRSAAARHHRVAALG